MRKFVKSGGQGNGAGWLTGWKEIASHCGLNCKTVQMYSKKFRLPVHRLPTGKPIALTTELESWIKNSPWKEKTR